MKKSMPIPQKYSFTLVEMLVVMAIIGILVALLMPTLGQSRERGRDARCKANLRNLHTAAMNYAFAEGGGLPHAVSTESYNSLQIPTWQKADTGWVHWNFYANHSGSSANSSRRPGVTPWWGPWAVTSVVNGTLWQYVGKSMKTYYCPTFALSENCGTTSPDGLYEPFFLVRSYVMNANASGKDLGDIQASRRALFADGSVTNYARLTDEVSAPLTQVSLRCLRDSQAAQPLYVGKVAWDGALTGVKAAGQLYPQENIGLYHNRRGNVIFVDGHVESLPLPLSTPPDTTVTAVDIRRDITNACAENW